MTDNMNTEAIVILAMAFSVWVAYEGWALLRIMWINRRLARIRSNLRLLQSLQKGPPDDA